MQWYIMYRQRDQAILRKHTDLGGKERIKARGIKQQNGHIYEHRFKKSKDKIMLCKNNLLHTLSMLLSDWL